MCFSKIGGIQIDAVALQVFPAEFLCQFRRGKGGFLIDQTGGISQCADQLLRPDVLAQFPKIQISVPLA